MRPKRHVCDRVIRWAQVVCWALVLGALAPVLEPTPAAAQNTPRVLVAVLPFEVNSARELGYLEGSLADLLASRLEASGRVEVVESITVKETLVAYPGERTESALRRIATDLGADYVVVGSLTELAGQYSLDVRVTPVDSLVASNTMVFTADGDDELLDRINELANRILGIVGGETTRARVAKVEIDAPPTLQRLVRQVIRTQEGLRYSSEQVRGDIERIREIEGVATATVETVRSELGVEVAFNVVLTERLLPSPETEGEGERVADVRVRGNQRIEANAILARVTTRPGDPYRASQVAGDVREVFALGFFRDVRVVSEESIDGRVLVFEVDENPVIRQVTISGNDSLDGDKIRDNLTLTTGSTLDYPLLFENRERMEALYRAEGYYLARVRYEIENLEGASVAIHFEVDENEKLRLIEISFTGNERFTDEELRYGLGTKTWKWYSLVTSFLDRSGTYSEPVFLQDLSTIGTKYLNAGYIQVEVGDPQVEPTEEGLIVEVEIIEGDPYNVSMVDVAGDETLDLDALRETLLLKQGEIFSRESLEADLDAIERRYTDRGFFLAEVAPLTRVDDENLTVDITFQVEKGPLYFLREIDIAGNANTVDDVIRREIQSVEGQLYSARAIGASRARIQRLGFFEDVAFDPRQTDFPDQLDLDVKVTERPTGSLSFGAGFSSADSFIISGSVSQSNLFGRGYGGSLSIDIGGRSDRFFLNFSDPYFMGTSWGLSTQLFRTEVEFEDFEQELTGIEFAFSHLLDNTGQTRGFLRYNYSQREVIDTLGVNAAGVIFRELIAGQESTSLFGVSVLHDSRNDRVLPTAGRFLAGSVDLAGFGGFSRFVRLEGRGAWYYKTPEWFPEWFPFRDESTWLLGIRAGYVFPFNDVSDFDLNVPDTDVDFEQVRSLRNIDEDIKLPLTERYFLGGLGNFQLRGFEARSVGPRRAVLRRSGLFGTGDVFTTVGRVPFPSGDGLVAPCTDGDLFTDQGDGDGQCNDLDDQDIDDFADLDETDVIGGNKFVSTTVEYRFPLSEELGLTGILFMDAGNAFAENETVFDIGNWRWSTGFGVTWFSPFGPLQAFVGFPIDKLEVEESTNFEFSVGGQFF